MVTNEEYEHKAHYNTMDFYTRADAAHMGDHVELVKQRALDMYNWLKEKKGIEADLKCVILAASFHDTGSAIQREDHNVISYNLFKGGKLTDGIELTDDEKIIIANAILQHSSHFKGNYYSIEAEIVASADRDEPDIYAILSRSVDYARKHNPDNIIDSVAEYNIKRYASFPSDDYRVPDWHFEYWDDIMPNCFTYINKFFQNEDIVKKVIKAIADDDTERYVREMIDSYTHSDTKPNLFSESVFRRFKGEM